MQMCLLAVSAEGYLRSDGDEGCVATLPLDSVSYSESCRTGRLYGCRGEKPCDADVTLTIMVNDKFVGHKRQTVCICVCVCGSTERFSDGFTA